MLGHLSNQNDNEFFLIEHDVENSSSAVREEEEYNTSRCWWWCCGRRESLEKFEFTPLFTTEGVTLADVFDKNLSCDGIVHSPLKVVTNN
jgi:hypothetical protein